MRHNKRKIDLRAHRCWYEKCVGLVCKAVPSPFQSYLGLNRVYSSIINVVRCASTERWDVAINQTQPCGRATQTPRETWPGSPSWRATHPPRRACGRNLLLPDVGALVGGSRDHLAGSTAGLSVAANGILGIRGLLPSERRRTQKRRISRVESYLGETTYISKA